MLRSLCPETVALTSGGHVRLMDFDLARVIGAARTFTMCGTVEYVAPEVLSGRGYGRGVDWWALGVLFFELLTGTTPFKADNTVQTYRRIATVRCSFPRTIGSGDAQLINQLLRTTESRRLGVRGGESSLKRHAFYEGIDWTAVERERLVPPQQPFVSTKGGVTVNYDCFPEENEFSEPLFDADFDDRERFKEFDILMRRGVFA